MTPQRIVLVSTPGFAHGWAPLNIARLKAYLQEKGHPVTALFLSAEWSDEVKRRYRALLQIDKELGEFGHTWHEMYFAGLLFGHAAPGELIRATLRESERNEDIHYTQLGFGEELPEIDEDKLEAEARRIERYCGLMQSFLLARLESIDWRKVAVAGFSCVEAQFLTSIYLARELKARWPHLRIVFGGPLFSPHNTEAFARSFPEIDHVVIGEGEAPLEDLLAAAAAGQPAPRLRTRLAAPFSADLIGRGAETLGHFPPPNYDDLANIPGKTVSLTTYMGKGCSHWRCSFCGIYERGQGVRPAAAVFEEICHLARTYHTVNINFGDWEINGDPDQLEELCDRMIAEGITIQAWAEINARNTSRRLFLKMKQAGIASVQIGVESFSPRVLRHIHKPATLLDNIKVLKWGTEAGMRSLFFNILCNHPLSTAEDAEINLRVLRAIAHLLRAPVNFSLNEMELYRTSDMFQNAERYGIKGVRDYRYYERCYPPERLATPVPQFNVAYDKDRFDPLWKEIGAFLEEVRKRPVTLTVRRDGDGLRIYDTRSGRRVVRRLRGLDARVLWETGERITTPADLAAALDASEDEAAAALARLAAADLVLEDRGRWFALPVSLDARAEEALSVPFAQDTAGAGQEWASN